MHLELRSDDQVPMINDVVALDPGIRAFMTGHFSRGELLYVGKGYVARIHRLAYVPDRVQSKWSQEGLKHGKMANAKSWCKSKCQYSSNGSGFAKFFLHQLFHYHSSKI